MRKQFYETCSRLKVDSIDNAAILQDFLIVLHAQRRKRTISARLPQCSTLTTSKTTQFCETSPVFEVGSIKNEVILRDFLPRWKVQCKADGLVTMRSAIFPLHLSKVLRLPRKSDARSDKVLHLSREVILANLTI